MNDNNLPDIDDTDLAPLTDKLIEIIQHLDELTPKWISLELIKNPGGEAIFRVHDGSEEVIQDMPLGERH